MQADSHQERPAPAAVHHHHHHHSSLRKKESVELGVLMLILAAETVADCCVTSDNALSTEVFATSRMANDMLSTTKMSNNKILPSSPSEATAPTFDSSSSAGGDSDSTTPVPESIEGTEAFDASLSAFTPSQRSQGAGASITVAMLVNAAAMNAAPLSCNVDVISNVLSYLSWRDNLTLRRVSQKWFHASLSYAVVCRMPHTGCPAIFIPCHRDLESTEAFEERRLATCSDMESVTQSWLCANCGWYNERRAHCGNRGCHAMAPSVAESGSCRIFLGQLRREGTMPLVRWLFDEVLLEPEALMMAENHRHKVTERGKGCAWVYVRNQTQAWNLLSYHRRMFFDTFGGIEGAWIAHPKHVDALAREVAVRGYTVDRPRCLPRNALVTELPLAQGMVAANEAVQPVSDAVASKTLSEIQSPQPQQQQQATAVNNATTSAAQQAALVLDDNCATVADGYHGGYGYPTDDMSYYHHHHSMYYSSSLRPPPYAIAVASMQQNTIATTTTSVRRHNPYAPLVMATSVSH